MHPKAVCIVALRDTNKIILLPYKVTLLMSELKTKQGDFKFQKDNSDLIENSLTVIVLI